jgi:hypothetical protein
MEPIQESARRALFRSKLVRRPLVLAYHRGLLPEDAFLASYPRSGVTWLRFVLCEALTGRSAEFGSVRRETPYIGRHHKASRLLGDKGRLIRTHETFTDGDRKVVYLVRDPRSVVTSEHSWQQRRRLAPGGMSRFLPDFLSGRSNPWGSWEHHVRAWLDSVAARNHHLRLVRFEDLRADTAKVVEGILLFLGEPRDPDVVHRAIAGNTIEAMQAKEDRRREEVTARVARRETSLMAGWRAVRREIRFVNTGSVESWKEKLTPEQAELIERRWRPTLQRLGYID